MLMMRGLRCRKLPGPTQLMLMICDLCWNAQLNLSQSIESIGYTQGSNFLVLFKLLLEATRLLIAGTLGVTGIRYLVACQQLSLALSIVLCKAAILRSSPRRSNPCAQAATASISELILNTADWLKVNSRFVLQRSLKILFVQKTGQQ